MTELEFIKELEKIDIIVSEFKLKQLKKYYNLVISWNKKINLTSITAENYFYLKHFYDSLTINKIKSLKSINSLCDIGTGAGFPGIVLKIIFPHLKITLIDSLNKRIKFLDIVIKELDLKNITTINMRAEDYSRLNPEEFDLVTARAVSKINILLELSMNSITVNGHFLAMKGSSHMVEQPSLRLFNELNCELDKELSFTLPFENSERNLILYKKNKKTSKTYPRAFDRIKKNPL